MLFLNLLLTSLFCVFLKKSDCQYRRWKDKKLDLRSADDSTQLLLIYAFVVFGFFQLVATKYTTYTFPALFSMSTLTAILYKDHEFRIQKAALACGVVYTVLAIAVAPTIMLSHSGKEVGEALAHLDTTRKTIAFVDDYRTSAVFYSGKTIYRAEPGDQIASMEPGTLSWNAKNVMPFIAEEKLVNDQSAILITKDNDRSPFLVTYNEAEEAARISVPGEYTLWVR